jgi:hypothetical protein
MLNIDIRDLFFLRYTLKLDNIYLLPTEFLILKSIPNKIILTVTRYLLLCLRDKVIFLSKSNILKDVIESY